MGEVIANTLDILEKIEEGNGKLGTLFGWLIIINSIIASIIILGVVSYGIIKCEMNLINWVIATFWG